MCVVFGVACCSTVATCACSRNACKCRPKIATCHAGPSQPPSPVRTRARARWAHLSRSPAPAETSHARRPRLIKASVLLYQSHNCTTINVQHRDMDTAGTGHCSTAVSKPTATRHRQQWQRHHTSGLAALGLRLHNKIFACVVLTKESWR